MEYQTPGVYVREVDSGPKPIAAAATSIPGFLGLFEFKPRVDAIALTAASDKDKVTAKLLPALVDSKGLIPTGSTVDAVAQINQSFSLRPGRVQDLKALLELNGHKIQFAKGEEGKVRISDPKGAQTVEVSESVVNLQGRVLVKDEDVVAQMFRQVNEVFYLDRPQPKKAQDLLSAYGYNQEAVEGTSLFDEYSVPPWPVHNKKEFFHWLQSFFAQYIVENESLKDVVGRDIDDPEEAADEIFEMLNSNERLKSRFQEFLSQPSVFNFVAGVQGFYDNGGGKCYVYLMGVQNTGGSIRGDLQMKTGLHAFDDCEDMALHAAPGLSSRQQKEMLEFCEVRKDRFAILDGPIVSLGDMPIPASDKGYGAMYVPWVTVMRPNWYTGDQKIDIKGPVRRKLLKCEKDEVYVPPSGHICGVIARVDNARGVHKAPANELLLGITGLSQNINKLEQGQYNERGINVIRDMKDRGVRVWGARTLATKSDPSWKYVNVRRLFIMVEQSLLTGSQWAVFEPNDRFLWSKLSRDVRSFLMRVWRSGALFGATPEEAFYVKCDDETNPRYLIDAGQVNIQVGIAPVKPAEFVVFSIGQWDGGASIAE
ncbi:MAG TPA: phage tail sheath subtilisin-like domain-containing protein [Myxococcota bacterium]|nr:phage tail sheath subtilisin-like domain-containing protein [Myxococcota bacterium]